jgi:hypothetical protein
MCSRSSSRYMNLPGSLPAYPPDPITGGHRVLRADRVAWEWPMEVTNCQLGSGFKLLNRCVLVYNPPKGVERTPVLSRDGPKHRGPVVYCAAGRVSSRLLYTKPSTHPPRTRGGGAAPPGGRRRASRRLYSVLLTPRGWVVGAASGRVPGPKFAAGTAAGAARGFLGRRESQKSVGFCPLGGAHQSAWSLYIVLGHTPTAQKASGGPGTAILDY